VRRISRTCSASLEARSYAARAVLSCAEMLNCTTAVSGFASNFPSAPTYTVFGSAFDPRSWPRAVAATQSTVTKTSCLTLIATPFGPWTRSRKPGLCSGSGASEPDTFRTFQVLSRTRVFPVAEALVDTGVLADSSPTGPAKNFSFRPRPVFYGVSFPPATFHIQLVSAPTDDLLERF